MRGHGQRDAFRRLRDDQANVRTALAHLAGPDRRSRRGPVDGGSLGFFWHLGRHLEGREVLAA